MKLDGHKELEAVAAWVEIPEEQASPLIAFGAASIAASTILLGDMLTAGYDWRGIETAADNWTPAHSEATGILPEAPFADRAAGLIHALGAMASNLRLLNERARPHKDLCLAAAQGDPAARQVLVAWDAFQVARALYETDSHMSGGGAIQIAEREYRDSAISAARLDHLGTLYHQRVPPTHRNYEGLAWLTAERYARLRSLKLRPHTWRSLVRVARGVQGIRAANGWAVLSASIDRYGGGDLEAIVNSVSGSHLPLSDTDSAWVAEMLAEGRN